MGIDLSKVKWDETPIDLNAVKWDDQPSVPQNMSMGEVGKQAVENFVPSAGKFLKDMIQPIIHPVDTISGLGALIQGLTTKAAGGAPDNTTVSVDALRQYLADRYGGYENIKRTMATDPGGFLFGDAATVLTGGGGLAVKAPGLIGKAGSIASKAGRVLDPVGMTMTGAGKAADLAGDIASGFTGFTTGAGKESVKQAYRSGADGISDFRQAMKGNVTGDVVRAESKTALQTIKDARAADYRNKLTEVTGDTVTLDIKPVRDQMTKLEFAFGIKRDKDGILDFSRSTIDRNAVKDVEHIIKTVEDWGTQPGDFSPAGMDILKRKLDDFYTESKNSKSFVTSLKNTVKETIIDQVPVYKEMLGNYEKTSRQIADIEQSLSLGNRTGADTGIRKLMSALKDNNEFRGSMIKALDEANQGQLASKLAGLNMQSMTPTSLMGKGIAIGGISSIFYALSPSVAVALSVASPRVVGELAYMIGKATQSADTIKKLTSIGPRQASFQAGRIANIPGVQPPEGNIGF
jgi:hypothetical protein